MKNMKLKNIFSNINNTINTPVSIKKNKSDVVIYTFYLTIATLVLVQMLFLEKFSYFSEVFSFGNSKIFNTFSTIIYIGVVTFCLSTLFLKPHIVNRILYFFSFLVIIFFAINYLMNRLYLNDVLNLPTIIICGIFIGLLVNSSVFMITYSIGTKQKINVLLTSFSTIFLFIVLRHFIIDVSKTFVTFVLPLISLLILLFVMSFLGKSYFKEVKLTNENVPLSPIAFFIIIFIFFVFNVLAFFTISSSRIPNYVSMNVLYFVIGFLISIIIARVIFQFSKVSNLFYIFLWLSASIITFQFLIFVNSLDSIMTIIIIILEGLTIGFGFTACYMVLGACLQDKSSIGLFRFCTVVIAIIISIALAVKTFFETFDSFALALVSQTVIFLFFCSLVLILIKSIFLNVEEEKESIKRIDKEDLIIIDTKYPNPYELLTNKEVIVFEQLLLGNTLRQIAGELHMKYDTVNFHYKNIYRKLEVNSRIELIVRYGKKIR